MRSFYVFVLLIACSLGAFPVFAANLRVTDKSGNVIELNDAEIDYTDYSFIYTPDFENSGIRAYQGEGTTTIPWERIKEVTILSKDETTTPYRLKAKISFKKNTNEVDANLVMDSKKGLAGKTALGDFSIDLEKVKTISVTKIN